MDRNGGTAGYDRLQLAAVYRPAADIVEEVLEWKDNHDFVGALRADAATNREELRAGGLRLRQRHRLVPPGALHEDGRNSCKRFDVVDRGRLSENSGDRRKRWLDAWI